MLHNPDYVILTVLCSCLLSAPVVARDPSRALLLNSSMDSLMRQFSTAAQNSSIQQVSGLTRKQFTHFLQVTTSHTPGYIMRMLGPCDDAQGTCTRRAECPGIAEIFNVMSIGDILPADRLLEALPVSLNSLTSENCTMGYTEETYHGKHKAKPSQAEGIQMTFGRDTWIRHLDETLERDTWIRHLDKTLGRDTWVRHLDKTLRRDTWIRHLNKTLGRDTWIRHLDKTLGRDTWIRHLDKTLGRDTWIRHLDKTLGRDTWIRHLDKTLGRDTWIRHLDKTLGRDNWIRHLDKTLGRDGTGGRVV
ncbi:hypothetical protein Btru_075038 [Bulinus truncatus]|nr:hypothetical protein Btru_075038 [Bulinus truncatus]